MRDSQTRMIVRRRIGDYNVLSRLGGGRYGVCYLALDKEGGRVVLKRFRTHRQGINPEKNYYEAVILSGLQHPAVPKLLGVLNVPQGYFFVLEHMNGITLEKWLFQKKKEFNDSEVFRIGAQLLEIISYLHRRSVSHGDISIANVLDDGRQVSLIDFGLARYMDGKKIGPKLDYSYVANLLLFLLYSSYHGKIGDVWYTELPLSESRKDFLMRMLGLKDSFCSTEEACRQFRSCFRPYAGL